MKSKKTLALILAVVMLVAVFAGCAKKEDKPANNAAGNAATEANKPSGDAKKAGVLFYKYSDPYLSTVRSALQQYAKDGGILELLEQDGQDNQGTQNDQLDNVISKGAAVLLVNIVDTGAAESAIEKAKAADLPLIFFNREPENKDVYKTYDKVRFVGTKTEEAGQLQGKMIADLWNSDVSKYDRNGNGKLDYVLFHGGTDNAEANARSKYSVEALKEAGIEVNEIGMQICNWDNEKAKAAMDVFMQKDLDNIDVVIANNDSMAIGAINALKGQGFNDGDAAKHILVYGVDALEEAKTLIGKGAMTGTIMQDGDAMAKALNALAANAAQGKDFLEGTEYKYDDSGVAVRIPYQIYEGK